MNLYFAYSVDESNKIYYGKYYGYKSVATVDGLLAAIFPNLQQCYDIKSMNDITVSIFPQYSTDVFSDKDPFKYDFVYSTTSPTHFYFNGTRMKWK
jgi:hypothetical protein